MRGGGRSALRAQTLIVAVAYTAYAVGVTWPIAIHPTSRMIGWGGDLLGATALWREFAEGHVPFLPGRIEDFAAPEGLAITYPLYVATWPPTLLMWSLSAVFGAPAAANIAIVSGFVLSGLAMFWLVRSYLGNALVAGAVGFAFAFRPDTILKAHQGAHMTHQWIWVLLLWRVVVVAEKPTRRNGILAGAAAVIAVSWNPYYLLIGPVLVACLSAGALAFSWRAGRLLAQARAQLWSWGILVGSIASYVLVAKTATYAGTREYGFDQLYAFSANPWEFLQPHSLNPLLGWLREPLAIGNPQTDTIMYVGLVALVFAAIASVAALTRALEPRWRATVLVLLATAVVGGLFSAPPTWRLGPFTIYAPAYAIGQVSTTWRVYARFGLIVSLAVLALAAIGAVVAARSRFLVVRAVAVAGLALLVLDTWNLRPTTTALHAPQVYDVLRREPAGIVAEYPITPNSLGDYWPMYFEGAHGHRILNGFDLGSAQEARALSLGDLSDASVRRRLSALGVRYVVVNEAAMAVPSGSTGLELVDRGDGRSLWRLNAAR